MTKLKVNMLNYSLNLEYCLGKVMGVSGCQYCIDSIRTPK
jgi:hypothetical protein